MPSSSGALPPSEAAQTVLENGIEHLKEPVLLTFVQNVHGGLLLSSGGWFSIILGAGFPQVAEANPGLQRLLQGFAFPFGLVLVYFVGAELFTGYPMWYTMTALSREGKPWQYVRGAATSWVGNLVGTLLASTLFTYATGILSEEPWISSLRQQISEDLVETPWYAIFVRSIACGWLVTIAMFLGNQNQDGISKFICLHLPFAVSTTARFPHTVEYMYLASAGMLLGAPLSIAEFFWRCLLPVTLGNIVGGGAVTGSYLYWTHISMHDHFKDAGRAIDGDDGYQARSLIDRA